MRFTRSPRRVSAHAITRRQALRYIGGATGALCTPALLSACGSSSSSSSDLQPEELDIETVVFVMMENRSFDHYFGALSLEEGRAVDGLRSGLSNPRPDGSLVAPFATNLRCVFDPPHGWTSSHRQVNGGRNDGFLSEHFAAVTAAGLPTAVADDVMAYHTRAQLPFFYGLADEFTLCDQWFCSVLGPTWPNRMFLHSAQSNGRINNAFPEDLSVGFTWPTIYDRLGSAGIEWRTYFSDLSFLLLWPRLSAQAGRLVRFEQFVDDARSGRLPPVCHVEPTFFGAAAHDLRLHGVDAATPIPGSYWGEPEAGVQFWAGHTFGGNPVACAVGEAAVRYLLEHDLVNNADIVGNYLAAEIARVAERQPAIGEIRGVGMLRGVAFTSPVGHAVYDAARQRGLLTRPGADWIGLAPPLITTHAEADEIVAILDAAIADVVG